MFKLLIAQIIIHLTLLVLQTDSKPTNIKIHLSMSSNPRIDVNIKFNFNEIYDYFNHLFGGTTDEAGGWVPGTPCSENALVKNVTYVKSAWRFFSDHRALLFKVDCQGGDFTIDFHPNEVRHRFGHFENVQRSVCCFFARLFV